MIDDMSMEGLAEVLHAIIHKETPPQIPPEKGLRNTQSQHQEGSLQKSKIKISEPSKVPPSGGG
jgi:hypothetical protein